jgi:hypothetical protein
VAAEGETVNRAGRWSWLAVAAGLAFLVLTVDAARLETPTIDEFAHVPAGLAILEHGAFELYGKNPPLLKQLLALPLLVQGAVVPEVSVPGHGWGPWLYGRQFAVANSARYLELFWSARAVSILLGLATGGLLFLWARRLFDTRSASIATALFLLNPGLLGHGHLATLDIGCSFTIFLTVFAFGWAYRSPGWARIVLAGGVWGFALLVKFTALLLLPALAVMIALRRGRRWGRALAELAAIGLTALLVVNAGMGFQGSFRRLDSFSPTSGFVRQVREIAPGALPVPLPAPYWSGFDAQKRDTESAEFDSYLFGEWSRSGWWYYDLVALAVKTPIPVLILLILCPWLTRRWGDAREEWLTLLVPVVTLLFFMLFFNRLNIGVRYLLPLLPFLYLFTAALWRDDGSGRWKGWSTVLAVVVLGYSSVVTVVQHPAHLGYFNLAAGGSGSGHRVLLDSNLDWGQDLYRLPGALREIGHEAEIGLLYFGHVPPDLYGIRYRLVPDRSVEGVLAVSVHLLMGGSYAVTDPAGRLVPVRRDHLAWLRDRTPVARAGSMWIFDTRSSDRDEDGVP